MTDFDSYPPFLTVPQVMEITQLGRSQVYRMMDLYEQTGGREGLAFSRFGRCKRILKNGLLERTGAINAAA